MRISDWSSDVCSSDLLLQWQPAAALVGRDHDFVDAKRFCRLQQAEARIEQQPVRNDHRLARDRNEADDVERLAIAAAAQAAVDQVRVRPGPVHQHPALEDLGAEQVRSEEHTSELQSLMRISYAVFCLTKKK